MASNRLAQKRLRNAILDLMSIRDNSNPTNAQRNRIKRSIRNLEDEYLSLAGLSSNLSYSEITGKLTSSESALKKIVDERNQLQNFLTSASKILGSITSVLKLIA